MSDSASPPIAAHRAPTLLAIPTYVLGKLGSLAQRVTLQAIAGHRLQLPHFSVLVTLDDFGPLAQHDIAARLGINSSHLVGYVDELERREAVRRERDPEDRRRQVVSLTPAGHALLAQLRAPIDEAQDQFLDVLSTQEQAALMGLLYRLLEHEDQTADTNREVLDDVDSSALQPTRRKRHA